MVIIVDENVSLALVGPLKKVGHEVIAIAETTERGMNDDQVWELTRAQRAILITRDYVFTNPVRFKTKEARAVIYLRRGNLRSEEEVELVMNFFTSHKIDEYEGCLVTLWPGGARVR